MPVALRKVLFQVGRIALDVAVLAAAFVLAYLVRYDWNVPFRELKVAIFLIPYVVLAQYLALWTFGVPKFSWRQFGLRDAVQAVQALAAAGAIFVLVRIFSGWLVSNYGYARYALIPYGVIAIDGVLAVCAVVGMRSVRRLLADRAHRSRHFLAETVPTLLIGAGEAGAMVCREMASRPDAGFRPVGFLDDDPLKHGTVVHGVAVLGSTKDLESAVHKTGARQVLITFAEGTGSVLRQLTVRCNEVGLPVKVIPGLYEIVSGSVNLSRIRDVSIEDLLRRPPVVLDDRSIASAVRDRVAMITGAGGSIGSELCRQILRFEPSRLILVERAENALFAIHRELSAGAMASRVVPCLADVCDDERMEAIFRAHGPHIVFHAAAHKHVPMMEWNPGEAVKNNVGGTRVTARLAGEFGVERFVMVSTDKAVNPSSVMGATKRIAEQYVQALCERSETAYVAVRFGNVLDSAGSVVPIFREQIAAGGPVTVTDAEMRRYFMTIPEACQLVLQAASMGEGGEVFILDMGEPVRIVDLAHDLIRLSGLRVGDDIEISFTGIRPGEKLCEELVSSDLDVDKTSHPKILIAKGERADLRSLDTQVERLLAAAARNDETSVGHQLRAILPEYQRGPSDRPAPLPDKALRLLQEPVHT